MSAEHPTSSNTHVADGDAMAHALSGTAPGPPVATGKNAAIHFGTGPQQQVHGAGETMDSSSRDSTRSSSIDSTASPEHKADAELMVSFLTEMHMKKAPPGTNDRAGCQKVDAAAHAPSLTNGGDESLLLSLKAKAKESATSSWGVQPTLASVCSGSSSMSLGTKPGDAFARIEDEEDDEDANIVVTFRRTASTSSMSDGSSAGEDSDDMSDEDEACPPPQHHRPTQSSGSWSLFNSLVTEAGNGSRKLERQLQRNYDCPWQRVGYYRNCDGKYGEDPSLYDSEDSDYEEPDEEELAAAPASASSFASSQPIRGGHGPFPSNYGYVRDMMLKMDKAADRPVPGGVPKYFRNWGKPKRRDAIRQQRIKREREERAGLSSYSSSLQQQQQHHMQHAPPPAHLYTSHSNQSSPSTTGSGFNSNLGNLAGAAARHGPLTPQRSPPKKGSGSSAKIKGSSSGSLKKFKIPGQPAPKRQSTALNLSFEVQANGLIRCKRCGKPDFKNHFALRSHLSHCPGTIHMKEQRMKIEAGLLPPETPLCLPVDEEEREEGVGNAAWVPAYSGSNSGSNLGSRSGSFTSDHPALPKSSSSSSNNGSKKKLGASSSSSSTEGGKSSNSNSSSSFPSQDHAPNSNYAMAALSSPAPSVPEPAAPAAQPVFEGKPLVPEVVDNGESLVGRTLSYRNVEGWSDVLVRNYRSRRNSHLVVYADQGVEWVVLTDRNCHLEAGYRGRQGSSSSSSSESASSDGESNASSSKRRTYRLGDTSAPSAEFIQPLSSGATTLESGSSSSRNAFFSEQDALLTPKRPGKRKSGDNEDEEEAGNGGGKRQPKMQRTHSTSSSGSDYQHPSPAIHTHMASVLDHIPHISRHTPVSSFICRRCNKNFHNKQALGWHTRKGCNGHPGTAVTNHTNPPHASLVPSGAAYPPPPPHMQPHHPYAYPHHHNPYGPPLPAYAMQGSPSGREVQPMPPAYPYGSHY